MLYKALEIEDDNIEILSQIGELYFLKNNYERAMDYLEKVLNLNPVHEQSLIIIRKIKELQGDLDGALGIAQKLFDQNKNSKNLESLIKILIDLKLFTEIEQYENSEFFNQDIKIECANAFYTNGELEKTKEFLSQCDENDEKVLLLQGKINFDKGDYDKAQNIFRRISSNTQNPEILNFLGLFDLENMQIVDAIKHFSIASNIDKNNPKYLYNLGNAYFYNGWMKEAQNAYSKAIFLAPDNIDYRYSLGYLYYDMKDFGKAKKEIDAILTINPEYNRALILKAILFAHDKNFIEAKNLLEQLILDDFGKMSLAKIYAELNIFDKAEKLISEVIGKNPENMNYLNDLAEIYIKEKDYSKAQEIAEKILKINPNYILGNILGAKSSYLKEDFEKTKEYAQEALSLDINCAEGYYYLALSREKTDDIEEAIECMKRAILYDLNNPLYYAKMSDFYKFKKDYRSALEYISEAQGLDDSNEYKFKYAELVKLNHKK